MKILDAAAVAASLTPARLVAGLERMFTLGCTAPVRHHHTVQVPGAADATLLLMPAWQPGAYLGTKICTIFPSNMDIGLPAVSAGYLLMNGRTGTVLALIDGGELTSKRTAATSALAARFLARDDAKTLLVIGTGRISAELARCHHAVRPGLERILVWGRSADNADRLASALVAEGLPAISVTDLATAVGAADIVSSATLSTEPLIHGAWVRPGTHVDLVGGFTPTMREGDDALIRAARVFADTRDGALKEAGDLVIPVARGILDPASVVDLHGLCRGENPGRRSPDDITLFKSVGAALEDLAAAILVYETA
ncbi:MAG: ornithine cyclodeaminase family protein [Proteobacteria bacterium]|nr:ornithine cyclodeaminase family protein [Pseudomonadota bacterium]